MVIELDDTPTLYDTEEFQVYAGLVEKAIRSLTRATPTFPDGRPRGVTIVEIHRYLGSAVRPAWTYYALESVLSVIEEGVPSRYRIERREVKTLLAPIFQQYQPKKKNEKAKA